MNSFSLFNISFFVCKFLLFILSFSFFSSLLFLFFLFSNSFICSVKLSLMQLMNLTNLNKTISGKSLLNDCIFIFLYLKKSSISFVIFSFISLIRFNKTSSNIWNIFWSLIISISKDVGLLDLWPLLKYNAASKLLNKSSIFSIVSKLIFNSLFLFLSSIILFILFSSWFIFFKQFWITLVNILIEKIVFKLLLLFNKVILIKLLKIFSPFLYLIFNNFFKFFEFSVILNSFSFSFSLLFGINIYPSPFSL